MARDLAAAAQSLTNSSLTLRSHGAPRPSHAAILCCRALESLDVFERLSLQQSATGVYLRRTNYLYRDQAHFPRDIQVG